MAVEVCAECRARYAIGIANCPHCGSAERTATDAGAVPPMVAVACTTEGCPQADGWARQVVLRTVAVGVVEVPRLLCADCGGELAITWPAPEEDDMPKITVHGGATNAADTEEGGEQPSPGSSSSASSETPDSTPKKSAPGRRSRARTTGSRSRPDPPGSSSAPSTDGGPTDPGSAADSDD